MQGDMEERRISVDRAVKWKFFEKAEKNKKKKKMEKRGNQIKHCMVLTHQDKKKKKKNRHK